MRIRSAKTRRDMELAAELRVAGATWESIGQQLERHPNVVVRFASVYHEEWQQLLREAEERVAREVTKELRSSMRVLLRNDDRRVRTSAVAQLTKLLRAERADEKPADAREDLSAFLTHVEQMSDDELEASISEFIVHTRGQPSAAERPT